MIGYPGSGFVSLTVVMLTVEKRIDEVDNSHWKIMGSKDETYLEAKRSLAPPSYD